MNSLTHCGISSGFLMTSVFMMLFAKGSNEFEKKLSSDKKEVYNKVITERRNVWLIATVAGVIASLVYHYYFNEGNKSSLLACTNTFIFFMVQYFVYILMPKKNWMLNHLEKKEEIDAWLEKYKSMSRTWHLGIVFGIVGYLILQLYIVKKN